MTWDKLLPMLWEGTVETLYMTLWSSAIAYLIGLPLGVLLVVTRRGGIMPSVTFNAILGVAINFLRSIPFIIMLAVLFPVTRIVVGTAIGLALGVLFCNNIEAIRQFLQNISGRELFSAEIYFLSQLPAEIDYVEVSVVVVISFLLSFLATIYPAYRAAKFDPVEALRYE